jgi:hypothetical protein
MSKTRTDRIDQFKDEDGRTWIWVQDGSRSYGIPVQTIFRGQNIRARQLGRKLERRDRVVGHSRRYALKSDFEEFRAARDRGGIPTPPSSEVDAIPAHEGLKISGLTRTQLRHGIKHGCWRLGGEKLWSERRPGIAADGRRKEKLRHVSKAQMLAVAQCSSISRPGPDPVIKGWSSDSQALEKWGIPGSALRGARERGEVRFKPEKIPGRWNPGKELIYSRDKDIEQYAARRELPSRVTVAVDFLGEILAKGPVKATEVKKQARLKGIKLRTLRRAKAKLKIKSSQVEYQGPAYWHLPEDKPPAPSAKPLRPLREKAIEIIRAAQALGPVTFAEIKRQAQQAGITRGTAWLAWKEVREEKAQGTSGSSALLDLDCATQTVTVKGRAFGIDHPAAFQAFRMIAEAKGSLVSVHAIRQLPGCKGRVDRLLREHLPTDIRSLIRSKKGQGGGYWLQLPRRQSP